MRFHCNNKQYKKSVKLINEIDSNDSLLLKQINYFLENRGNQTLITIAQSSLASLSDKNIRLLILKFYFHINEILSEDAEDQYFSSANSIAKNHKIMDPEYLLDPYFIGIIPIAIDTCLQNKANYKKLQNIKKDLQKKLPFVR